MRALYIKNDTARGVHKTFLKLVEEVGELAEALFQEDKKKMAEEMADVIAWTASIANLYEINLEQALYQKYPNSCPKCQNNPCTCEEI